MQFAQSAIDFDVLVVSVLRISCQFVRANQDSETLAVGRVGWHVVRRVDQCRKKRRGLNRQRIQSLD